VTEVDKLDEAAEVDEVEEKTTMVDPFKQWEDMCSNYLRNQMIERNTSRQ